MILVFVLSTLFSQSINPSSEKWINIGSLQSKFNAAGAEIAWNAPSSAYEGMRWPAMYSYTDNHVIDRQWIVCKNFTDVDEINYNYLGVYFSYSFDPNYGYPTGFC